MKGKLSALIYRVANERIQGSPQSLAKVLDEIDSWERDIRNPDGREILGGATEPYAHPFTEEILDKATEKEREKE